MKKLLLTLLLSFLFGGIVRSQCTGNCTLYTVSNIPVSLSPNAGTALVLGDDQVSAAIPIGFTFSFMCTAYTNLYVSSNGFLSFNAAVSSGCCSGQLCPTAGGNPNNYIAFAWNDLYPPGAGTIKYQTLGVSPNRIFVLTYSLIPFCCGAGPPNVSGQIKLFETTNVIEVHNAVVGNQGSNQTQGIMNAGGTSGFPVAGRNSVAWTANNDAYRWTPSPPLANCVGTPTPGTSQASPTTACSSYTTNLSLLGSVQACSLTYQWQQAAVVGGPYTNIAGATSSISIITHTAASTFYRCVLMCGASSASSTPVNCVIPACVATPTAGTSQSSQTTGCASYTTNLSLVGSVQSCGLLYQWQSAAVVGGPYTNIAGATSSLAIVTHTAPSTFYRCFLTCGSNTAASTPVNCLIPPCAGAPIPGNAVANPTTGCLTANSNLSLTGTVVTCGLTYQWQRATALAGPYTNIAGLTSPTAAVTSTVTNYYRCILSCGASSAVSTAATVSITPGPCPSCVGQFYVNSNIGQPWGSTSNITSMNAVFGATWTQAYYETVNVVSMLQPTVSFIFLEGGDNNATAMNTFVTANIVALQNWVTNGGKLLMNSAPNVGGNMNWGFGGILLTYAVGPYSTPGYAAAGQAAHPIFNGPFLPAGTGTYTGNWFCHGYVSGGGITDVIVGATPGASLGEKIYGAGRVMAGSMTTWNFHTPVPNSENLLENIFTYLNCAAVPLPLELTDYYLNYNGQACDVIWITAAEKNTDHFIIERSFDGINYSFLAKVPAAINSKETKKYITKDLNPNSDGVTYYRLKQFDKGNDAPQLNLIKILNLKEKNKQEIKVQPNPASSYLDIYLPETFLNKGITIQVFDNAGKRILSVPVNKLSSGSAFNLNIESLLNGLYSLQVFDENGTSAKTTFIKN